MRRPFLFLVLSVTVLAFVGSANGAAFCTMKKLKTDLSGDWKGGDTYFLRIQKHRRGQTCFSIYEPNSAIVREVRDVVIRNGEVMHLTYYTPATNGYIVYSNLKIEASSITFDWFSSYDLATGKDTYVKQKAKD